MQSPAVLVAESVEKPGVYEVIDGLQRLNAIFSYIENFYPDIEGRYFDVTKFSTAAGYAEAKLFSPKTAEDKLPLKEVSTILDYPLALSVMRNATETEVNDVFDRINTYGHRLSDQERRQAGVQNDFSSLIRDIACVVRGDVSREKLPLYDMPSISINLPKMDHGYEVDAEEVFWVKQGILRSTDLRDSLDEQCIADITASVVLSSVIDRSKEALDLIYSDDTAESKSVLAALGVYGVDRLKDEFKFCIQELEQACEASGKKLRDIIFSKKTTNAFPSVFAVIFISFHEIIVREKKRIANYETLVNSLHNIVDRLETGRKSTSPDERQKNILAVKGLIGGAFVDDAEVYKLIYSNHTAVDLDGIIRRSETELSFYELKQGCLNLDGSGSVNEDVIDRIINTICAIANNGPKSYGKILIGVSDKPADTNRIKELYKISPRAVGKRSVVGVSREADKLGIGLDKYLMLWKQRIEKSQLSDPLKSDILSNIDYNDYFGLGVIVITIPEQKAISFVGDEVYWRSHDNTIQASGAKKIAEITARF
ncbi:AlbA family DNA-binding domain-containing protein [Rhizobium leguminosarum]|uniref:AlbA family DNA-binding domain-containing protein n=2 Tax=Rhizobium leguminosarum TaxID=384 RepID=UPI0032AFD3FA